MTVQPHWCGERLRSPKKAISTRGSAPLVWGTSDQFKFKVAAVRFSPTGVGNVITNRFEFKTNTVQPHWCGERNIRPEFSVMLLGSAPLVWGTLRWLTRDEAERRFSPTGVGNVKQHSSCPLLGRVQPHWCGERNPHNVTVADLNGSAPLVWGTYG